MVAVVGERFAGEKDGKLSHNALTLYDNALVLGIGDDPFTAFDRNGLFRLVVDGDEVNKRVGAVRRRIQMRSKDDAVHGDSEFGQCVDHGRSRRELSGEGWCGLG